VTAYSAASAVQPEQADQLADQQAHCSATLSKAV